MWDGQMDRPGLTVLADQADKRVDLCSRDVFLQQLAVVVEQSCDGVLCQDVIANLFLHEAKLLGDVLLQDRDETMQPLHFHTVFFFYYDIITVILRPVTLPGSCGSPAESDVEPGNTDGRCV